MNIQNKKQWMEKTKKLNESVTPSLGMRVVDVYGFKGVVVKVNMNDEVDGTIYVWQEDRLEYGADNCEHYCLNNWKSFLRVLDV